MTPKRLQELKQEAESLPDEKYITILRDSVREILAEVERLGDELTDTTRALVGYATGNMGPQMKRYNAKRKEGQK